MSAHLSPPFRAPTQPPCTVVRAGFGRQRITHGGEQNRQRHTSSREPGMFMKTQAFREKQRIHMTATKNLGAENKGVMDPSCRL